MNTFAHLLVTCPNDLSFLFPLLGWVQVSPAKSCTLKRGSTCDKGEENQQREETLSSLHRAWQGRGQSWLRSEGEKWDLKIWPRIPDLQLVFCTGSAEVHCLCDLILVIIIVSETRHHGNQCIFFPSSLGWYSFSSWIPSLLNGWQTLYQR